MIARKLVEKNTKEIRKKLENSEDEEYGIVSYRDMICLSLAPRHR